MADRKPLPGKFVWFEHNSNDAQRAQAFYRDVLGWQVEPMRMGDQVYEMIQAGATAIGGYTPLGRGRTPHWISYVSVEDVDKSVAAAQANGGKVVEPAFDVPTVGRMARLADPQGAEFCVYKSANDDAADVTPVPHGWWLWNELHTPDPLKALAFYEKVVGFTHRAMEAPGHTYYIIGKGGVDRGGVTHFLEQGQQPHWLPYIAVDDADQAVERARKAQGKVCMGPADIPDVGRFAVLQDPTGASFAVMKPLPM